MGRLASAGPRPTTMTVSAPNAAPTPQPADRQPRVTPTASTIVSASTISTEEARNAAANSKNVCIGPRLHGWGGERWAPHWSWRRVCYENGYIGSNCYGRAGG